jgi:WD repeat-containing protein 68
VSRMSAYPVAELSGHSGSVNSMAWAPHSSAHIVTGGDDRQALIWDVSTKHVVIEDPILAFMAQGEINQLQWDASHEDWIAICFNNTLQVLKV